MYGAEAWSRARQAKLVSGYDPVVSDTSEAIRHLLAAASRIEAADWARQELDRLAEAPCAPGREPFRQAVRTALSRPGA